MEHAGNRGQNLVDNEILGAPIFLTYGWGLGCFIHLLEKN